MDKKPKQLAQVVWIYKRSLQVISEPLIKHKVKWIKQAVLWRAIEKLTVGQTNHNGKS